MFHGDWSKGEASIVSGERPCDARDAARGGRRWRSQTSSPTFPRTATDSAYAAIPKRGRPC